MSNYTDEVLNSKKYGLMGVSPKELHLRQTKKCWLEVVKVKGKLPNTLFCTDGKEYAETNRMLNPTFECIKCLTAYVLKIDIKNEK